MSEMRIKKCNSTAYASISVIVRHEQACDGVTCRLVLLGHENEHRGVSNPVVRHSIVIACILTCAAEVYDIAATIRVLSLRSTIRIAVYDVRISPFRQSLIGLRSVKSPLARRSVQLV